MYGIGPTFSALLQQEGWNQAAILFIGNSVGICILLILIRARKLSLKVRKNQLLPLLGLGGTSYLVMALLLQTAYRHMLAGLCTMLHFVYPVIVMAAMILLFKERVTARKVVCMAMSLGGIVLIVGIPGRAAGDNMALGAACAALSGVAYAVFVVANDKSAMARLDATVSTFYVLLVGAVLMGLYMLVTGDVAVNFEGRCLAYASVYPTTSVVGLICLAQGVHRIGATRAAIINMLEPAVSMLVSVLVFGGEEVTAFSLVGCAMILASVVVVTVTKAEAGAAPLPQDSQGGGTSP